MSSHTDGPGQYTFDLSSVPRGQDYLRLIRHLEKLNITAFHTKWSTNYLRSLPLGVDFLIDVGVNFGTPELYPLFSGKRVFCIDPFPHHFEKIATDFPSNDFTFITNAAGRRRSTALISEANESGHNSLHSRVDKGAQIGPKPVVVNVDKLDRLIPACELHGSGTLKVDVEGHELEVLRGAVKTLNFCSAILLELSIRNLYHHSYKFADVVRFLDKKNFRLYEILNSKGRPPAFLDCIFLRDDPSLFQIGHSR